MNAKQQYKLAYSAYRQSKGSTCLHGTPAVMAAWHTFTEQFWFKAECDPLPINVTAYRAEYTMPYAKYKIRMLIHWSSDFHLSKVSHL